MTPRLDAAVIDARLRELSRRLARVEKRKPLSARRLALDEDLQDIVARNLELAIQACVDIAVHVCGACGEVPAGAADAFDALARRGLIARTLAQRLRLAVGFRNVLAHEYAEVDWKIVVRVATREARDLGAFGKAMVALLEKQGR
jgi:uncharacterized protein YutE (UPF0331/DUF86 family)